MEWSPACGVLGVPISLQAESQTGLVSCSVTQLFAKVILDVPHALLLPKGSERDSQTPVETTFSVALSEDAIILKSGNGETALEARPWGILAPQSCQWHSSEDHSIRIILAKAPSSLGSWPYSFQSLILHTGLDTEANSMTTATLEETENNTKRKEYRLCDYDKNAFIKHADALLASHKAESRALKAAFAHAIAEQTSTLPCGPLGQSAFLFPQQGPHCLSFLKTCSHIPSVRKLVRLAHTLTGIELSIGREGKKENDEKILSPSFYSLQSIVCCLIAGLAAVEQYRLLHGIDAIKSINACVGFGAGEYAAAVFAGALRLQDALVALKAHADAFTEDEERYLELYKEEYNDDNVSEGCRSRAIEAVRAALSGAREKKSNNEKNAAAVADAAKGTKVADAIHVSSTGKTASSNLSENELKEEKKEAIIRAPRLRMYSGADGVAYENIDTSSTTSTSEEAAALVLLNALPFGACAAHATASHRHNVRIALMQQGVAELTVLVPEEGDEEEAENKNTVEANEDQVS